MKRALVLAAAGIGGYLAYRALRPRYEPERGYDHIGFRVVVVKP